MRIRPDQLSSHLQQRLLPIYLVGGEEPLQVQESCDAIRQAARTQGYTEREVMSVERGFAWESVMQEADSLSLFGDRKILEIRMPTGKPGDAGAKVLAQYAERPPEDTLLLVICGKLDAATLKTKWAGGLDRAGAIVQVWPVEYEKLPGWIQGRMRARGLQASREAVNLLAERVEGNLLAAAQEIEKLLLLHGPGRIDIDFVADAVADSARYSLYGLVDTALSGRADRMARMMNGLRGEGMDPVLVLWALSREIRSLARIARHMDRGKPLETALNQERVWERRKTLVREAVKRHDLAHWYGLLQHCARIDRQIKGLGVGKPWDELLQLGFDLAGKPVIRAAS